MSFTETEHRTKLTPPELAALWGLSTDKILAWIRAGELRAFNAVTRLGGRPRWLIDIAEVEAFEARRSNTTTKLPSPKRRRRPLKEYTQFEY
jgi:excisionase family DNA binding protein